MLKIAGSLLALTSSFPSFDDWVDFHGKQYNPTEFDYRNSVYYANLNKIALHNYENHTWTMAVNQFADLTADEFKARYTGGIAAPKRRSLRHSKRTSFNYTSSALPDSVDWTSKGAVTPVKDQGQCGSCWAFSTTGSTESAWYLAKGQLVSLSEQELVDCSQSEGNEGCNGGLMDQGFQYIIDNKGITTEAAYPYTAADGTCQSNGKPVAATISNFVDVPANSDSALMTAVAQQPVSVAVEADQNSFQFYSGGVMTAACGTNLDHGVLAVGYGTDAANGGDYYLVKNSWGATWGEKGYIRLGRGAKFAPNGQCGILMVSSYPVV